MMQGNLWFSRAQQLWHDAPCRNFPTPKRIFLLRYPLRVDLGRLPVSYACSAEPPRDCPDREAKNHSLRDCVKNDKGRQHTAPLLLRIVLG